MWAMTVVVVVVVGRTLPLDRDLDRIAQWASSVGTPDQTTRGEFQMNIAF